jgi:hypothetical protein
MKAQGKKMKAQGARLRYKVRKKEEGVKGLIRKIVIGIWF